VKEGCILMGERRFAKEFYQAYLDVIADFDKIKQVLDKG
jgi:hypothetical protein